MVDGWVLLLDIRVALICCYKDHVQGIRRLDGSGGGRGRGGIFDDVAYLTPHYVSSYIYIYITVVQTDVQTYTAARGFVFVASYQTMLSICSYAWG